MSSRLSGSLRSLLLEVGFENIITGASYENHGAQGGAQWASGLYRSSLESPSFGGEMVRLDWADAETVASMVEAWKAWARDERSYYSIARVETVGWKPT